MLPSTTARVPLHTPAAYNVRIRQEMELRLKQIAAAGPRAIDQRLSELDAEWDIERTLEANASSIMLLGVTLGATIDRRFLVLPGLVAGFLLQHALQGWCPPLPLFRHLGVRTSAEIEEERYALKAMRGDFQRGNGQSASHETAANAASALRAVRT